MLLHVKRLKLGPRLFPLCDALDRLIPLNEDDGGEDCLCSARHRQSVEVNKPTTHVLFLTLRVVGSHNHCRSSETAAAMVPSGEESKSQDRQGPADSDVPNPATVVRLAKSATMHAVIISGLELALSLINVLEEDAFRFDSYTNLVFGASAFMEAFGLLFVIFMTLIGDGDIGDSYHTSTATGNTQHGIRKVDPLIAVR